MSWLSSALNIGGQLLGGLVGKRGAEKGARIAAESADRQTAANTALQREFAQMGVRWKVEDAKAAGLHPLFAMGGSGAAFAPNPIHVGDGGQTEAGRAMGQAISRAGSTIGERNMQMAQLKVLEAQAAKDYAQAQYWASEAARKGQNNRVAAPAAELPKEAVVKINPVDPIRSVESHPLFADAVMLKPDEMTSRSSLYPGQTASVRNPSMKEFELPNGDRILLPATQGGGIPEEIDMTMIPEIIGANIRRYGASQAVIGAIMRWFGGKYEHGMFTAPGYRRYLPKPRND